MQGTFDPLPVSRQLDTPAASRQPEREDQGRKLKSESKESKDSKEYKEFLQFKQAKRSHLDALENVPWSNMAPANDKDTQRRMRQHRDRELKYSALSNSQLPFKPKVSPYPETPDKVFPGVPCYKLLENGVYRYVFIVDQPAGGWNGCVRAQTSNHWITSHFIYRDPVEVANAKERWKRTYDDFIQTGNPPPGKIDFNSLLLIPPAPGAVFPPYGPFSANDSYYIEGTNNPNANAPQVTDPLFCPPFNNRVNSVTGVALPIRVRPYPYRQHISHFPQLPDPVLVYAPLVPAGGAGAAGGGPGAAGGAGGGPGAGPAGPPPGAPYPPHQSQIDAPPPLYLGQDNVDWIHQDLNNYEIGSANLKAACEQAEELDYAFALSIQGLKGTNLSTVWNCTDPEYSVTDRAAVIDQFVKTYMQKFYSHVRPDGAADVEDVVHEALRLHEEFCKGWISTHHRTLTAQVVSAGEALVGMFFDEFSKIFPNGVNITRAHLARFLRRNSSYSGEFAHCLYHYMTSLEQMRGNRNPSYRAMQNEHKTNIIALKKMAGLLQDKYMELKRLFFNVDTSQLLFSPYFIDWHYVATQMPAHHKEFDEYSTNFPLYRTRTGGRTNAFPPWQQMRGRF